MNQRGVKTFMVANKESREVVGREPVFVGCPVERYVRKPLELIVAATDLGSCREDFLFWKYLLLPLPPFGLLLLTRVCSLPISHL